MRVIGHLPLVAGLVVLSAAAPVLAQPRSPVQIHHIHGLALDRRDPEILYVATHTGLVQLRRGRPPAWVGEHRFDLMGFTAHPGDPAIVFASGHPDVPTYARERVGNLGLLVSRDGGATWQSVALRGQADFHALTLSPRGGGQLYGWSVTGQPGLYRIAVGTWRAERLPARGLGDVLALAASADGAGPLLAGTSGGLLTSHDGGLRWAPVPGLPGGPVTAVVFHTDDPGLAYAWVQGAGLMRSRDQGRTWQAAGPAARENQTAVALAAGPGGHVVVALSDGGIVRSRDGGRTWHPVLDRGRPVTGR